MATNKIEMFKGNSETFELEVVDDEDAPVDITDAEIILSVKQKFEDEEFLFQRKNSFASGGDTEIKITDGTGGLAEIYLIPANTSDIEISGNVRYSIFVYDVWVKLSSGFEKHVIVDNLFIYKVVK